MIAVRSPHEILEAMKRSLAPAILKTVALLTCAGFVGVIYAIRSTEQLVLDAYGSDWTTEFRDRSPARRCLKWSKEAHAKCQTKLRMRASGI